MPTEQEIEAAARTLCKSGRFETGEGTCAFICMDQLGDPRKHGCHHVVQVHGHLANAALEAVERVRWMPIATAPRGTKLLVWSKSGGLNIAKWDDDCFAKRPRPFWNMHSRLGVSWSRANQPTHWLPLPPPPKASEEA